METQKWQNVKVAVLGFGVEGKSAVKFLKKHNAEVSIYEEKEREQFDTGEIEEFESLGARFLFGKITDLSDYAVIVRSPGIRFDHFEIAKAQKNGAILTSATKIFFDLCPCSIIGVTGTKGKGTTSTLIFEMLKAQGYDAYLGGNIGTPPLEFIDKLTPLSKVVLELSSFQLHDATRSPHVAVILMVTSEHMDYHKDTYEYIEAKRNILRFQSKEDIAVINKDYPASNESDVYTEGKVVKVSTVQDVEEGCFTKNNKVILIVKSQKSKVQNVEEEIINIKDILLPGRHNLENVCAAVAAASESGVEKKNIISVLKTFKGLEHRIELVDTIKGVRYYNDSFSTTPETAIAAIEAFQEPKILILGGSSKGSDFTHLGEIISKSDSIKAVIGIGVEWERMKSQFQISNFKFQIYEGLKDMDSIVRKASEIASLGDVVLLSPACASFDMFKNYKDRGLQFKEEVEKLKYKT
jgi:UDP-N-acetylmuramoylalanine--D-glutamate ligase